MSAGSDPWRSTDQTKSQCSPAVRPASYEPAAGKMRHVTAKSMIAIRPSQK